jgi:N-dimethylarginine dimethylaminohydrolase
MSQINKTVLMSGANYFTDEDAINALMDARVPVDRQSAIKEHQQILEAFKSAGIKVIKVDPPKECQDGIYTANWALVRNNKALMARLPNKRKPEESYAVKQLTKLGLEILTLPDSIRAFSGQGDALICDDIVFCQSPYRTSVEAHPYLKDWLGLTTLVEVQTKPSRWFGCGPAKTNRITGWPDSPTYDIDLAISILRPKTGSQKALIAYCPGVFKRSSRKLLAKFDDVDKILVEKSEAMSVFALNLVSTGETVIMHAGAPNFKRQIEEHGLKTIELSLPELRKGGGSIRCSSLTIS